MWNEIRVNIFCNLQIGKGIRKKQLDDNDADLQKFPEPSIASFGLLWAILFPIRWRYTLHLLQQFQDYSGINQVNPSGFTVTQA